MYSCTGMYSFVKLVGYEFVNQSNIRLGKFVACIQCSCSYLFRIIEYFGFIRYLHIKRRLGCVWMILNVHKQICSEFVHCLRNKSVWKIIITTFENWNGFYGNVLNHFNKTSSKFIMRCRQRINARNRFHSLNHCLLSTMTQSNLVIFNVFHEHFLLSSMKYGTASAINFSTSYRTQDPEIINSNKDECKT